jgi:hypothetical protein
MVPVLWLLLKEYRKNAAPQGAPPEPSALPKTEQTWAEAAQSDFERAKANIKLVASKFAVLAPTQLRIPLILSVVGLVIAAIGNPAYDFFVLLRVLIFITCLIAVAALRGLNSSTTWLWTLP